MRKEQIHKTGSLVGASDLTIIAPIKKGFIPALDAVTYKTRVKRVLKALHLGRTTAHEYDLARVLSDAVERVGRIHSIRIAVLEPEDKVLLAVTFDGAWESYIRVIWQNVSRSLDLIFCNTEDYDLGWTSSFETWCNWLRAHQAESPFFYSTPGLTFHDAQYLRSFERFHRRAGGTGKADVDLSEIKIYSAEASSDAMFDNGLDPTNAGYGDGSDVSFVYAKRQTFRQGVRSLVGLYRLAEWYLPDTDDGKVLKNAAVELLREFAPLADDKPGDEFGEAVDRARRRFKNAMDWFGEPAGDTREVPAPPTTLTVERKKEIQAGILHPIANANDGCLIFLTFASPQSIGNFLSNQKPNQAIENFPDGSIAVNLAISLQGMYLAGYSDDEISQLPEEFVQGMESRAGALGDVRHNHPRRWNRPALNWVEGVDAIDPPLHSPEPRINFKAVHAVIQFRLCNGTGNLTARRNLLLEKFKSMCKGQDGVTPLSIQWMSSLKNKSGKTREHFGFLDSASQPVYEESEKGDDFSNLVHAGEVLWGYPNAADKAKPNEGLSPMQKLLFNGSFLVIRKLRQDIGALDRSLDVAIQTAKKNSDLADKDLPELRRIYLAKMMGRWPDDGPKAGEPLADVTSTKLNDFNFAYDPRAETCPFHAHIRRANPRTVPEPNDARKPPPGERPPRIVRRGMSYGATYNPNQQDSLNQERGLVFMAYNASIGEQFEVIQRWLTGGNSSGSYSGQSDPFLGVSESGRHRYFEFQNDKEVVRMALDGSDSFGEEPVPIVRLEWGVYLFTPSIPSLAEIAKRALAAPTYVSKSWDTKRGEEEIRRLQDLEKSAGCAAAFTAWKAAIEDPMNSSEFVAASIWAAIREKHDGVLKTPFGVLVASKQLIDLMLRDETALTATGYLPRMRRSFGPLYLGLDGGLPDKQYETESAHVNAAIMELTSGAKFQAAVDQVCSLTKSVIQGLADASKAYAVEDEEPRWEVTIEAREIFDSVLASMCEEWFGLSEKGDHLQNNGVRWNWKPDVPGDPPCYPGHFMAPSRYVFQPHPGPEVERVGALHGEALSVAMTGYLNAFGKTLTAPIVRAILDSVPPTTDPTYAARTLVGVLMGFLPTTDGNLRRILNEWLNEGTLWTLRNSYQTSRPKYLGDFCLKLRQAMQLRAAPELLWRAAVKSHKIGAATSPHQVTVDPGDFVISSLISASHECLENNSPDLTYAFGGDRSNAADHPRHACPGYGPATAVIFGVFRGLVESGLPLQPGPAPLSLWMDGPSGFIPKDIFPTASASKFSQLETAAGGPLTPVMKFGDSWMTDFNRKPQIAKPGDPPPTDKVGPPVMLAASLRRLGLDADTQFSKHGWTLEKMAKGSLNVFSSAMVARIGKIDQPKAILISGGGNDLVQGYEVPVTTELYKLLKDNPKNLATAFDTDKRDAFVARMEGYFMAICAELVNKQNVKSVTIPILISAYGYPIVDGRFLMYLGQHGPWLEPVFDERKFQKPVDKLTSLRTTVLRSLIDSLNGVVAQVAAKFPNRVHHLDLRTQLEDQSDFKTDYTQYWDNELHATEKGFNILAQVVIEKLAKLGVK